MDIEAFKQALNRVQDGNQQSCGIGTLGEKTLHAVLKYCYEPREENHEIKIGGYVADIVGENGIIEIQTRNFDKLRKKLSAFLEVCDVTIVYPVAAIKWLIWIDPQTGSVSSRRKSPRKGKSQDICNELYKIRTFLAHPRLHLKIVLLELEEYRYQNGWGNNGKRGSVRCDRIPISILGEVSTGRRITVPSCRTALKFLLPQRISARRQLFHPRHPKPPSIFCTAWGLSNGSVSKGAVFYMKLPLKGRICHDVAAFKNFRRRLRL